MKLAPIITSLEATGTDVCGRPPVSWEEKKGSQSLSGSSLQYQHFSRLFKMAVMGESTMDSKWEMCNWTFTGQTVRLLRKMDFRWWLLCRLPLSPCNCATSALLEPDYPSGLRKGTGEVARENMLLWWGSGSQKISVLCRVKWVQVKQMEKSIPIVNDFIEEDSSDGLRRNSNHSARCPGNPDSLLREDTGHTSFISWCLWICHVVHLSPGCQHFQSMAVCSLAWDCRPLRDDGSSSKLSLDSVGASQSLHSPSTLD